MVYLRSEKSPSVTTASLQKLLRNFPVSRKSTNQPWPQIHDGSEERFLPHRAPKLQDHSGGEKLLTPPLPFPGALPLPPKYHMASRYR